MEQPYQTPLSEPLPVPEEKPRKVNEGMVARFAACAAIMFAVGLMLFFDRYESFSSVMARIPDGGIPSVVRSTISGMSEQRAPVAGVFVALIALLLSLTRLTRAAQVLAFAAAGFLGVVLAVGMYLLVAVP